jgi:hypothetical protein
MRRCRSLIKLRIAILLFRPARLLCGEQGAEVLMWKVEEGGVVEIPRPRDVK